MTHKEERKPRGCAMAATHAVPEGALDDLPEFQGYADSNGAKRHLCPRCAYTRGFEAGRKAAANQLRRALLDALQSVEDLGNGRPGSRP